MRKLLSLALLAVFGLVLAAPFFAGASLDEARLPACCRRAGAHHCTMREMPRSATTAEASAADRRSPRWSVASERCPFCPAGAVAVSSAFAAPRGGTPVFTLPGGHPAAIAQTECLRRIARDRACGKRGPPASALFS